VITGTHLIAFAEDADAARAFFAEVLGFSGVDAGDGWLIFALPPAELAVHPGRGWAEREGGHRLFLMCDEIEQTVAELREKGVEFKGEIVDEGWGLLATLMVPGHGEVGLYEPRHPSPLEGIGAASE
jgi:catechol 2,3-dioxygenase-like lactoylglutathione lyase family enzyme